MEMKRFVMVMILPWLLLVVACNLDDGIGPCSTCGVWVAMDPIQCLGNPWERDWLESHDWEYSSYPKEWDKQSEVIADYYERQGITVLEVERKQWKHSTVCAACSCPAGYTLYLRVIHEDRESMLELGYRIEVPLWYS